jgi:hypothetical protein
MTYQKTANTQATTKQVNATDLTQKQKRELFCECLAQTGFIGFTKKKVCGQTYYTFTYMNQSQ